MESRRGGAEEGRVAGIAYEMDAVLVGNASNPNSRYAEGRTALHRAAAAGHPLVCEFLIHRGTNPFTRERSGKIALDVAKGDTIPVLRNEAKIERVYFAHRFPGVKMPDAPPVPQPLINQFATVGHFDLVQVKDLLAKHPALLLTRASWDEMAIESGAHTGQVQIANFLAEAGQPVSICPPALLALPNAVRPLLNHD